MKELLLITDVARLIDVFGQLADGAPVRLRVANTLDAGGEELSLVRPDVVFVQTHLSGLSADILLLHLKRMVHGEQPAYILLATGAQASGSVLQLFQGWIDTSLDNRQLMPKILDLLAAMPGSESGGDSIALPQVRQEADISFFAAAPDQSAAVEEPTPADLGIGYPTRKRPRIDSEFNSSFDNAVSRTAEPEAVSQVAPSVDDYLIPDQEAPGRSRRKSSRLQSFVLWLVPVVAVVIGVTYLQVGRQSQEAPVKPAADKPDDVKKPGLAAISSSRKTLAHLSSSQKPVQKKISTSRPAAGASKNQGEGNRPEAVSRRPAVLPGFIPREAIDRQYSVSHPNWERYVTRDTEYRVSRENSDIHALQVIARSGTSISGGFLDSVFRSLELGQTFTLESATQEKDFKVERGRLEGNIRLVYYRDKRSNGLKAFVISWQ
ncbi:MAG TPA: hypothetical protein HPP76_10325 [Desulfuromonadales bacterium]|nr:hypothetical protein [Desulfuromonadales bacterium]